jgi:hypothetical protein
VKNSPTLMGFSPQSHEFDMKHLIDADPQDPKSDDKKAVDPEFYASTSLSTLSLSKGQRKEPKDLKLLEILIDKVIERLEDNTCQPKIQDALKAIQLKGKVAEVSEAEKTFWDLIEEIKTSELPEPYPESIKPNSLESQILKTILGLKDQVKNGILPVKTITDTFNQERSKESQFTYHRIGRLLSSMGFRKARTGRGASAILWEEDFISRLCSSQNTESMIWDDSKEIKPSSEPSERSETSETPEAKEVPSPLMGDRADASPGQVLSPRLKGEGQVENPARGGGEVKPNLNLCPPSFWSHRH